MEVTENGICGYELNNPDMDMFDTRILAVHGPCGDCDFAGTCLTPCESVRCLTPKKGNLVELGRERTRGARITYFAVLEDDKASFVRLSEPDHYWAKLTPIGQDQVPNWALSRLNANKHRQSA